MAVYRLERWRERALSGIDEAWRERESDPVTEELVAAMKRIAGGMFGAFIDKVVTSQTDRGTPSKPGQTAAFRASAPKHGMEFLR